MRSAAVVFNPHAGRGRLQRAAPRVLEALQRAGFEAEAVPTRGPGDAEARARECVAGGVDTVFALGGDGTLRECAAGILGSSARLAFLPSGTMNVMALEFGIRGRPEQAARSYATAREVRFGVGLAGTTPFLMQVSAGVDAFLIASLRAGEKRRLGRASVVPAVLRALIGYRFPPFTVESSSGRHQVTLAVASNIIRYGGPFRLTPGAISDSPSLDLFLFAGKGKSAAVRFALSLLVGRHLKLRGATVERVRKASFLAGERVPVQIDGDLVHREHFRALPVSMAPERLTVLVPAR